MLACMTTFYRHTDTRFLTPSTVYDVLYTTDLFTAYTEDGILHAIHDVL